MKRGKILGVFLLLIFLVWIVFAIPDTINLHGRLTDDSGEPISGTKNITFKIYSDYSGGDAQWDSGLKSVELDEFGIYSIILSGISLPFSENYYLGITVSGDSEMSPRVNLTSTPYAFRANETDYLDSSRDYEMANLTLAKKITFALGSFIENVASNVLRIGGNLEVDGNVTAHNLYNKSEVDGFNLSKWIDDLGNRGYTHLTNFTNDLVYNNLSITDITDSIGNFSSWDKDYTDLINTPTNLSEFIDDLGDRGYTHLTNFTNNLNIGNWTADKEDYARLDGANFSGEVHFNGDFLTGGVSIIEGDLFAQRIFVYNISSLEVSHLNVNGSLIPQINNTFDLGNESLRYRNAYFSGNLDVLGNISADNLAIFVPYTGATSDVNLGENTLITNTLVIASNGEEDEELNPAVQVWTNTDDPEEKFALNLYNPNENQFTWLVLEEMDFEEGLRTDTIYSFIGNGAFTGNLDVTGNVTGNNLNINNWDTVFGWGNHAEQGYLTSYTETDPLSLHLNQETPQNITGGAPTFKGGINISEIGSYLTMKGTANKISFEFEDDEKAFIDMAWNSEESESSLRLIADNVILGDAIGTAVVSAGIIDVNEVVTNNLYLGEKESEGSWRWFSGTNVVNWGLWDGIDSYETKFQIGSETTRVLNDFQATKPAQFQDEVNFVDSVYFNRDVENWVGTGAEVGDWNFKVSNDNLLFSRVSDVDPISKTTIIEFSNSALIFKNLSNSKIYWGGLTETGSWQTGIDNGLFYFDRRHDSPASNIRHFTIDSDGLITAKNLKLNTGEDTSFETDEFEVNLGDFGVLPEDLIIKAPYLIGTAYLSLPEIFPVPKITAISDSLFLVDESDRDIITISGIKKDFSNNLEILLNLAENRFEFNRDLTPNIEDYEDEIYYDLGEDGLEWNNLWLRGDITSIALSGSGNAYACIDSQGRFFRSASPCV